MTVADLRNTNNLLCLDAEKSAIRLERVGASSPMANSKSFGILLYDKCERWVKVASNQSRIGFGFDNPRCGSSKLGHIVSV